MKNILISCISLIKPDFNIDNNGNKKDATTYQGDNISVQARQTNEACVKFLMKKLYGSDEVLDKYFRIQSTDVARQENKFTIRYLNDAISNFCNRELHVKRPDYENFVLDENEEREHRFDNILNSIAQEILQIAAEDSDIHIYLDMSGGKRDNSLFIQLLTKLLSFYGYGIHAYYTDLSGPILDMGLTFDHMKILDAVNEFVRRGSAASLRACFSGIESPTVRDLLLAMEDFENSIQLCDINLYENLTRVNQALNGMENVNDNGNGLFIIKTVIPLIRQKFHISTNGKEVSRLGIIRWCLENGLIQQALTIYNEIVKNMIIEEGLIEIDNNVYGEAIERMMIGKHPSKLNNIKVILVMRSVFDVMYSSARIGEERLRITMDRYRRNNPVRPIYPDGEYKYNETESYIGSVYFSKDYIPYGIKINIAPELCRKILTDCNFVSLIRNRVNHAAGSAVYDHRVINLLQSSDYHFLTLPEHNDVTWDNITPANIRADLLRALENLETALSSIGRGHSK